MLELRHLRHLAAIVDHGGLEKAAEALGLTQPALTKSVRRMEELLGVPMFERAGRRLVLTPIGAEILGDGRRLLREADDVERRASLWRQGQAGRVTVGVGPAVQAGYVPEVLRRLSTEAIEGSLLIETGHAENLLPRLMAGTLDFAVYDFTVDPHDPDIVATPLKADPIVALVRSHHPLIANPPKTAADLIVCPMGSVPAPPGLKGVADALTGPARAAGRMTLECDSYVALVAAAKTSHLAVLTPARVAAHLAGDEAETGLAIVRLDFLSATTRPQIIRRRHRPQSPLARRVMKLFEEVAG